MHRGHRRAPVFQVGQPLVGNLLRAKRRVRSAAVALAMPVRTAAAPKAECLGSSSDVGEIVTGVTRVPGLDCVEALVFQGPEIGNGPEALQVRRRDDASSGM